MKAGIQVPNGAKLTETVLPALQAGVRAFDFTQCVDFDWNAPVRLDDFWARGTADTLLLRGAGILKTVLHRTYSEPAPALGARSVWLSHFAFQGVTWIDNAGNVAPLVSLPYTDRGLYSNMSTMGGLRGLELGVGGDLRDSELRGGGTDRVVQGVAGEFRVADHCEFSGAQHEGLYGYGVRNFSIGGRTSAERNGLADPGAFAGISLEADPLGRSGHGVVMDVALEHDDPRHVGLRLRGLSGMHVGANRHVLAGMDAECFGSSWYRSVVYADNPMRRAQLAGLANQWVGRKQVLSGSRWSGYSLADEPEANFDLRLPLNGSGT